MTYARFVQSRNRQAVRLQKEFRLTEQVPIFRQGKDVVLRERPVNGAAIFDVLLRMPHEFMPDGRDDSTPQERESF